MLYVVAVLCIDLLSLSMLSSQLSFHSPFQNLSREKMEACIEALQLHAVEKGEVIVRAGELLRTFCMVHDGVVGVFEDLFVSCVPAGSIAGHADQFQSAVPGPQRVALSRRFVRDLSPGESFGEVSLLHHMRTSHTYQARSVVRLWVLDRVAYQHILHTTEESLMVARIELLQHVAVFERLPHCELRRVAAIAQEVVVAQGHEIVRRGSDATSLVIIKSGSCLMSIEAGGVAYNVHEGFACGEVKHDG
jgi:CRP-like cAMP-binding protein